MMVGKEADGFLHYVVITTFSTQDGDEAEEGNESITGRGSSSLATEHITTNKSDDIPPTRKTQSSFFFDDLRETFLLGAVEV
jgi:hypothetical protein